MNREKIRALMQAEGRNYQGAVLFLRRKELGIETKKQFFETKMNYLLAEQAEFKYNFYDVDRNAHKKQFFEKVLNAYQISKEELLEYDDKDYYKEKQSFSNLIDVLADIYYPEKEKTEAQRYVAFKLLMKKANVTYQDIANKLGCTRQNAHSITVGKVRMTDEAKKEFIEILGPQIKAYLG